MCTLKHIQSIKPKYCLRIWSLSSYEITLCHVVPNALVAFLHLKGYKPELTNSQHTKVEIFQCKVIHKSLNSETGILFFLGTVLDSQ
jgi:hypothetical protein